MCYLLTLQSENIFRSQRPSTFAWTAEGFEEEQSMFLASEIILEEIRGTELGKVMNLHCIVITYEVLFDKYYLLNYYTNH